MATVNTETLKVRTTASTDAEVLGLVSGEDDLTVVDESTDGWVGVSTADGTGYVSTDYAVSYTHLDVYKRQVRSWVDLIVSPPL